MKTKVLLDTDIGSDIDDAVALAYLLANPDCELLGITTVTGEAEKRAQLANVLCRVAGKDVPIYPGVEQPLLVGQKQPFAQQAVALANWDHAARFEHGQAIHFLQETIHLHPGEVVLLTIGPLTNIALLFGMDPEIPYLLKGLIMMCGVFTNRLAGVGPLEWNAVCDPHATAIVYQRSIPPHHSVGLDVTCRVTMEAHEVQKRFTAKLLQPVVDFARVWFEQQDRITFHDPLAATIIFDDRICSFQTGKVEVELTSLKSFGMTFWTPQVDGPHEVALDVDPERFFMSYFSAFDQTNP